MWIPSTLETQVGIPHIKLESCCNGLVQMKKQLKVRIEALRPKEDAEEIGEVEEYEEVSFEERDYPN